MTRRITERLIAVLLVLFLLVYVIYQAQRYLYRPVTTDTVYEYSVSRSITTRGIAIRDEGLLDERATGIESYPLEDASRVALGETVVELYRGGRQGDSSTKRAKEIREEIQRLQDAQSTPVDYANTEVYNRDIKAMLSEITEMSSNGRFEDLAETRNSLTLNINKKQRSKGSSLDFSLRIEMLESELAGLEQSARSEAGTVISAPVAGYFSRTVDGLENKWKPADLSDLSIDQCLELIDSRMDPNPPAKVGKMVYSQNWTFVASVPSYNNEWLREGQKVRLQLEHISRTVPATIRKIIDDRNHDTAILLLTCSIMDEEIINLRQANVVIHFENYTGIRISTSDLRFIQDEDGVNQRGVYVLDDHVVRFKLVDAVYEEEGFVLSTTHYVDSVEKRYVRLFDQVITKYAVGVDIYDGKTIQDY